MYREYYFVVRFSEPVSDSLVCVDIAQCFHFLPNQSRSSSMKIKKTFVNTDWTIDCLLWAHLKTLHFKLVSKGGGSRKGEELESL